MYKHILIATDGSDLANKALAHGLALAKALSAKASVVTVTEPYHVFAFEPQMVTDTRPDYEKHARQHAEAVLRTASKTATELGIDCNTVHTEGDDPFEAIIKTAGTQGCDLIVMASHGRRGISALLIGSQTVKVLTHSKIPVLVCR